MNRALKNNLEEYFKGKKYCGKNIFPTHDVRDRDRCTNCLHTITSPKTRVNLGLRKILLPPPPFPRIKFTISHWSISHEIWQPDSLKIQKGRPRLANTVQKKCLDVRYHGVNWKLSSFIFQMSKKLVITDHEERAGSFQSTMVFSPD